MQSTPAPGPTNGQHQPEPMSKACSRHGHLESDSRHPASLARRWRREHGTEPVPAVALCRTQSLRSRPLECGQGPAPARKSWLNSPIGICHPSLPALRGCRLGLPQRRERPPRHGLPHRLRLHLGRRRPRLAIPGSADLIMPLTVTTSLTIICTYTRRGTARRTSGQRSWDES
jgi:hypothetical protein